MNYNYDDLHHIINENSHSKKSDQNDVNNDFISPEKDNSFRESTVSMDTPCMKALSNIQEKINQIVDSQIPKNTVNITKTDTFDEKKTFSENIDQFKFSEYSSNFNTNNFRT